MLAQYLVAEFGCEVALLGIQPAANAINAPLSAVVEDAVDAVAAGVAAALSGL